MVTLRIYWGITTAKIVKIVPRLLKIWREVYWLFFFWNTVYIYIYIYKSKVLYFTYLPRSPQWTDLHQIWHRVSSPRRNHVCQIFCRSVQGFRSCRGSKFAILHWLSRSPLTHTSAVATAQPVIDVTCDDVECNVFVLFVYDECMNNVYTLRHSGSKKFIT